MAFLLVSAAPAAVNDLYPTDFYGVAEGHGTITGYVFDRKQIGNYVNGRHSGEIAITSHIGALRMSRCFSLAGWKVAPVMVISGAEAELSGRSVPHGIATHASGYADLRIGGTIGLIDEPRERNFLAINVATVWPTGQYEKSALLNIGENRRRQALTLGWVKGFGKDLTLELSPDWAWYQSNTEAFPGNVKFDQRPTQSLTGYLSYRFSSAITGFVGAQITEGGETALNGISQNNPIHCRRAYLGGSYIASKTHAFNLRFAKDESVRSGLKLEQELSARWLVQF